MSKDTFTSAPTAATTNDTKSSDNNDKDNTKIGGYSQQDNSSLLASIITQTDKYGNPLNPAPPPPTRGANDKTDPNDVVLDDSFADEPPKPYVQRFLCCLFVYKSRSPQYTTNSRRTDSSLALRPTNISRPSSQHESSYLHSPTTDSNSNNSSSTINSSNNYSSAKIQVSQNSINWSRRPSHYPKPVKMPVIDDLIPGKKSKKCLALDLDETLVHSSFDAKDKSKAHIIIPINIDGKIMDVYVIKRPGVDQFLLKLAEYYELFIYTASLSKYADPLLDKLDTHKVISKRLYRENCVFYEGHYVKDLYLLNRDLSQTIIVDNSPMSYKFNVKNAIDCSSFIEDPKDTEMWEIADFLISIADVDDVSKHCNSWRDWCNKQNINYSNYVNSGAI